MRQVFIDLDYTWMHVRMSVCLFVCLSSCMQSCIYARCTIAILCARKNICIHKPYCNMHVCICTIFTHIYCWVRKNTMIHTKQPVNIFVLTTCQDMCQKIACQNVGTHVTTTCLNICNIACQAKCQIKLSNTEQLLGWMSTNMWWHGSDEHFRITCQSRSLQTFHKIFFLSEKKTRIIYDTWDG